VKIKRKYHLTYSKRLLHVVDVNCSQCNVECQRFGTHRNGLQRFRCPRCHKTFTEEQERLFAPMILPEEQALRRLLVLAGERNGIWINGSHLETFGIDFRERIVSL
jgi:transposase-like protein